VLEGPALSPWTVAQKCPRLWINPWAPHPLALDIPVPHRVGYKTGVVEYYDVEAAPARLFDLTDGWPGPIG
jgi:hypothetical protein